MSPAESTFVKMYEEHYDEVLAFCERRVGPDDADDVTADVFAAAWRRIDHVDVSLARAWLFGVARNVVLNQWRSTSRRRRLRERVKHMRNPGPQAPETFVVRRSEDEVVLRALQVLRPGDQEILRLAAWEELSGAEIATVLDISTDAVHQRLHRAKRRLAAQLADTPQSGSLPRGREAEA
ncbi:MAG: sigma-70 family RNA polymerase sigma factor [Acidimicrobiia bacterium]|nr:sigma-70 family RNA polymerase sigma factor [Acidimicrobiia bacterium]